MKKLALYLGIFTISIFFYSCNADREESVYNGPQPENVYPAPKLLKITERVFVDNDTLPQDTLSTVETHFTYNNIGQLTETDNGTVRNEISYSGTKKVTSVASYEGSGLTTAQFNYSGDKLLNILSHGTHEGKIVYNYTDNKVSSKDYFELENNGYIKKKTVFSKYLGDNAYEERMEVYQISDTLRTKTDLIFDMTLNPFNFLNQYLKISSFYEEYLPYNFNNRASTALTDENNPASEAETFTYTVTPNQSNYATTIKMVNKDGFTVKEWIFEYVAETPAP